MNPSSPIEDIAIRRKRLKFRSWHRGIQEADILLGNFADRYLHDLTEDELDQYEDLLEEQDIDIVAWIGRVRTPPSRFDNGLMVKLQTLDYVKFTA